MVDLLLNHLLSAYIASSDASRFSIVQSSRSILSVLKRSNELEPNLERKHQIHHQSKFGLNSSKGYGLVADLKNANLLVTLMTSSVKNIKC